MTPFLIDVWQRSAQLGFDIARANTKTFSDAMAPWYRLLDNATRINPLRINQSITKSIRNNPEIDPYAYIAHDTLKAWFNLSQVFMHMTAWQQDAATLALQAYFQPVYDRLKDMDNAPESVTFHNFYNKLAQINPQMKEFADRIPDYLTIHFGANDVKSTDRDDKKQNQPLEGEDTNHIHLHYPLSDPGQFTRGWAKLLEIIAKEYPKPDYKITHASIENKKHPVKIKHAKAGTFTDLLHFDSGQEDAPKIFVAAPMSGHYSTLVRQKIQSYLNAGMNVYVLDIKNARDIPADKDTNGLNTLSDDYVSFIEHMGPHVHIDATCQACTPTLIASSWIAKNKPELKPASLNLVAGPVNPHAAPTVITDTALNNHKSFFKKLQTIVPDWYTGAGRAVVAGFTQLTGFMLPNLDKHIHDFVRMMNHYVVGGDNDILKDEEFRDEYHAVNDIDGGFHYDTCIKHFQKNQIFTGQYIFRGEKSNLGNLSDIPLLTIGGRKDDITASAQVHAAHQIIKPKFGKMLEINTGHYGSFHGTKAKKHAHNGVIQFIHRVERKNGNTLQAVLGYDGQKIEKTTRFMNFSDKLFEKIKTENIAAYKTKTTKATKEEHPSWKATPSLT